MLSDIGRQLFAGVLASIANFIRWTGVSPNLITLLGFCLTAIAAVFATYGQFLVAGILLALGGTLDALDGALARVTDRVSRYGAFLDSTLDRYSEVTIYLGLLVYYTAFQTGHRLEILLIYLTIVGSLLVSYTRARAEGIGVSCRTGLFTRAERWITLVLGLLFNQVLLALWLLAVLSNLTALQRVYAVWKATRADEE